MVDPVTGFLIGGTLLQGKGRAQQSKSAGRAAALRAQYEPLLIRNQSIYQAHVLRRQAQLATFNAELTERRRNLLYGISAKQISRLKDSADRQIARRNNIAQSKVKRNNKITQERKDILLRRLGYKAEDLGQATGETIAERDIRRSASGFSLGSVSYERRRLATRNRLRDRLERLSEEYTGEDELLALQNYNQNMSMLEQVYLQNEGVREQVYLRANQLRDQALVRDAELRDSAYRSRLTAEISEERAGFEEEHGENRARFAQIMATHTAGHHEDNAALSWLSTAFDIGTILAPSFANSGGGAPGGGGGNSAFAF